MTQSALRLTAADNVATALAEISAGQPVAVVDEAGAQVALLTALADIPCGHKLALVPIPAQAQVIKYGYGIGLATAAVCPGQHVHTHNLASARGRGDL